MESSSDLYASSLNAIPSNFSSGETLITFEAEVNILKYLGPSYITHLLHCVVITYISLSLHQGPTCLYSKCLIQCLAQRSPSARLQLRGKKDRKGGGWKRGIISLNRTQTTWHSFYYILFSSTQLCPTFSSMSNICCMTELRSKTD